MALSLNTNIIIISAVFSVLAVAAVLLRFRARMLQHAGYSVDDYLIIPGMIFVVGFGANNIAAVVIAHLGEHVPLNGDGVPTFDDTLMKFKQLLFAAVLLPILSHTFTKLSIVCFYRRIFRGRIFSIVTVGLMVAISVWGVSFFFASLFECYPIEEVWLSLFGTPRHNELCYNYIPMYYATAIANVILDVLILSVPVPMVWRLTMPTRQKIAVISIFLLGGLVTGIGAARVYFFFDTGKDIRTAYDITYNQAAV